MTVGPQHDPLVTLMRRQRLFDRLGFVLTALFFAMLTALAVALSLDATDVAAKLTAGMIADGFALVGLGYLEGRMQ